MKNFIILFSFIFSFLQVVMQLCTVGFLFFSKKKFISKKRMLKYTFKLQVISQNYNPNRFFFFFSFIWTLFGPTWETWISYNMGPYIAILSVVFMLHILFLNAQYGV